MADVSDTPIKVMRWTTTSIQPAPDSGGFVAYGDYLELERMAGELAEALEGENYRYKASVEALARWQAMKDAAK